MRTYVFCRCCCFIGTVGDTLRSSGGIVMRVVRSWRRSREEFCLTSRGSSAKKKKKNSATPGGYAD